MSDTATDGIGGAGTRARKPAGARRRVTLAQVAARAGVSTTAASFVLSGRQDQRIAEVTQQRVRAVAEEMGYKPNLTARTLRTGESGTIAFVSDFVSSTPYASAAVRGALEVARQHDRLLYIAETLGDPELEDHLLQGLIGRRVDGFIYATMFTREVQIPEQVHGAPLVLLNCTSPHVTDAVIIPDERRAGHTAARALLDAGHRDDIYIVGTLLEGVTNGPQWENLTPLGVLERLSGIDEGLAEAGVTPAGRVRLSDWEPQISRAAIAELLASGRVPRALICGNDRVAFGAYQALASAGLRVPADVSIVSFDNSDLATWLEPGLSSIALPYEDLGRRAVESLLAGRHPRGVQRIEMTLHARGSIGAPRTR